MAKPQGLLTTALVASGLLVGGFRGGHPNAQRTPEQTRENRARSLSERKAGPWTASCRYWQAGNHVAAKKPGQKGSPDEATCSARNWGLQIPHAAIPANKAQIAAVIALVPDPVHSSLGLQFDRSLDVLTQAAAEYNYVAGDFWLPWNRTPNATRSSEATKDSEAAGSGEDGTLETEPGLLILKTSAAIPRDNTAQSASPKQTSDTQDGAEDSPGKPQLIYIFLVGQSPAIGVNGEQLQHALSYEQYLHEKYGARLTVQSSSDRADVIGPENSGAASSLRAGLESAIARGIAGSFQVFGSTATREAASVLNAPVEGKSPIHYVSFLDSIDFKQNALIDLYSNSLGHHGRNLAIVQESGTVFGQAPISEPDKGGHVSKDTENGKAVLTIHFPREISSFRNAQKDSAAAQSDPIEAATATPYMHFSLKDSSISDTLPDLSPGETPFSQEAEWMTIVRELKRRDIAVIAISASSTIDELFLAKMFHRDVPDAQLAVLNSDLLFTRIGDNVPYIGTITLDAYPLTGFSNTDTSDHLHSFADDSSEALFNAASYAFWDGDLKHLHLADYWNPLVSGSTHPPLWATAVGRDGYYPLGLVSSCASIAPFTMPPSVPLDASSQLGLSETNATNPEQLCNSVWSSGTPASSAIPGVREPHRILPSFAWYVVSILCILLCLGHSLAIWTASFWSPFTHDLAVRQSDQPRRRTVYMRIGASMLFAMNFVVAWPIVPAWHLLQPGPVTIILAFTTVASALLAALLTFQTTRKYTGKILEEEAKLAECLKGREQEFAELFSEIRFYLWFNRIALLTGFLVPAAWLWLTLRNDVGHPGSFLGLFFSFRCFYPASGVSPMAPILLILFTWYLWAMMQTMRLRFSPNSRPRLPRELASNGLYVSDESLSRCSKAVDSCLYTNAFCLLISRQFVRRAMIGHDAALPPHVFDGALSEEQRALEFELEHKKRESKKLRRSSIADGTVTSVYLLSFLVFVVLLPIHSLDQFLRVSALQPHFFWLQILLRPSVYTLMLSALFYPLLVIAITGAVRMLAIWSSLRHGLLEPLERSPLRFAFSRLTNVAWTTMLRQGGMLEYWRDMMRSNEAMNQLTKLSNRSLAASATTGATASAVPISAQATIQDNMREHIKHLIARVRPQGSMQDAMSRQAFIEQQPSYLSGHDLPSISDRVELNLMCAIEYDYAAFAEELLQNVLIPFWTQERLMPVESEIEDKPVVEEKDATGKAPVIEVRGDVSIRLAEEFIAMRYFSLIRALLINLRFVMTFISAAFVISLVAWNSYPFQPKRWVDWVFTALLMGIGSAVVWVFAQMHRDPILSRITGTKANTLDGAFYVRLLTFGAVPFLTWVASQFPAISDVLSRLLQSGAELAK